MDEKLKGQLATLRAIRNDLVHSHFRFVQLDGQLQAIAVNAQNSQDIARNGRLLRITDFKTLNSQIGQVTKSVG